MRLCKPVHASAASSTFADTAADSPAPRSPRSPSPAAARSTSKGVRPQRTMSAKVYGSMPQAPRRYPLASTVSHQATNVKPFPTTATPGTPPKSKQQPAAHPADPPLQRQNAKVTAPSPPRVIRDKAGTQELTRIRMLGEVRMVAHSRNLTRLNIFCRVDLLVYMKFTIHEASAQPSRSLSSNRSKPRKRKPRCANAQNLIGATLIPLIALCGNQDPPYTNSS